LVLKDG
jgi:hypothetical protein